MIKFNRQSEIISNAKNRKIRIMLDFPEGMRNNQVEENTIFNSLLYTFINDNHRILIDDKSITKKQLNDELNPWNNKEKIQIKILNNLQGGSRIGWKQPTYADYKPKLSAKEECRKANDRIAIGTLQELEMKIGLLPPINTISVLKHVNMYKRKGPKEHQENYFESMDPNNDFLKGEPGEKEIYIIYPNNTKDKLYDTEIMVTNFENLQEFLEMLERIKKERDLIKETTF